MEHIVPLILTYNESANIARVLECLLEFKKIIVVDSFSSDNTQSIIKSYSNTILYERKFDNHSTQWNYGLSKVSTDWVLSLDADYIITNELFEEISNLSLDTEVVGYRIKFHYCIQGTPLRGTILPPRIALFNKNNATYIQDGHTQDLIVNGEIGCLNQAILHDDRKSLDHWLEAQLKYSDLERHKLLSEEHDLTFADRVRYKQIFAPFAVLFYCLFIKGCVLDGKQGLYYSFQRMYFEVLLSLKLMERKLDSKVQRDV